MILDVKLNFGTPAISTSNTAVIGTNIHNAAEAKLLFKTEGPNKPKLFYSFDVDTACEGFRIDVHATDQSDGDVDASEAGTEVLASTGIITDDHLGAALGSGTQRCEGYIILDGQQVARQYYTLALHLAGTTPSCDAGDAYVVLDAQTNMVGDRAAIPA